MVDDLDCSLNCYVQLRESFLVIHSREIKFVLLHDSYIYISSPSLFLSYCHQLGLENIGRARGMVRTVLALTRVQRMKIHGISKAQLFITICLVMNYPILCSF